MNATGTRSGVSLVMSGISISTADSARALARVFADGFQAARQKLNDSMDELIEGASNIQSQIKSLDSSEQTGVRTIKEHVRDESESFANRCGVLCTCGLRAPALFNLIILLHLQCHFHLAEAEAAL